MPFYYSEGAERGHIAEQARRVAAGREPFSCPYGCPCGHGSREMNSDEQRTDRWARLAARDGIRADR